MIVTTKFHKHVKLSIWRVKVSIIIPALIQILTLLLECFADRKDCRESEEKTAAGQSSRLLSSNTMVVSPAKPLISVDPSGNERGGVGPSITQGALSGSCLQGGTELGTGWDFEVLTSNIDSVIRPFTAQHKDSFSLFCTSRFICLNTSVRR